MDKLQEHEIDGIKLYADLENKRYYIEFRNYENMEILSEIPEEIYNVYLDDKSIYKKDENEKYRHWEFVSLSDIELYNRTFFKQKSIDSQIIKKETYIELIHSIRSLPRIQKKRIYQYYFKNKTETEIAQAEGISQKNVSVVLTKARINLYKILKKFE